MLSIVLPTFNEAHNIAEVTQRIVAALSSRPEPFEIIIVDDGNDETAAIAQRLADEKAFRLQVIRRPRRLGLATAVVAGWQRASGSILGAMDADLQHPPELLCSLADLISSGQYNIAIASRCVPGSSTKGFPWHRSFLSGMARWMGNLAVPRTNRVSDPMSGMFLMHAEVVRGLELKPLGYKILLEVLARSKPLRAVEVPFAFGTRMRGNSKLGLRQSLECAQHFALLMLKRLRSR